MSVLPITQQVRNNIIRVLSDAHPQALYTAEVLALLAEHYGCNHTFRRNNDDPRYVPTYLPHGCTATPQYPCRAQCWHTQAYPSLRALARQDSVEWKPAEQRNVGARWRYIPHPDPSPAPDPDSDPVDPPYRHEIIDLDEPLPGRTAPTDRRSPARHDNDDTPCGQVIDAHDRFTQPATPQQHPCRECGHPARQLVLPHVDHRRRKPWPKPYWLCGTHSDE